MPHRGQFIVDIVEIDANAVHQPSKPGDEVVVVLNGILRLTTDADGDVQDILAGEAVLIPAGWAGLYRVIGERGRFRELAIVPHDYFDPGVAPPPNDKRPLRLDFPSAPGRHQLHRGCYEVEMVDLATAERGSVTTSSEEIIRVLAGTLKLIAGGASQTFAAGSVLVLPVDFHGDAETSAGYRSMNLRWIG